MYNVLISKDYKENMKSKAMSYGTNKQSHVIEFPIEECYIKTFKMRRAGVRARTIEVSIPRDFYLRLLRNSGLSEEEFLEAFRAVAYFSSEDSILYRIINPKAEADSVIERFKELVDEVNRDPRKR